MQKTIAIILSLCLFLACEGKPSEKGEGSEFIIVASTSMLADTVSEIAGERATVIGLMGPGIDPHLYKPTRSDIALLNKANVVFYNGAFLEGKMEQSFTRLRDSGKSVFAVADLIDPSLLHSPTGLHGAPDPHIWMDPKVWSETVRVIRNALAAALPDAMDELQSRAAAYREKILKLDTYSEKILSSVPSEVRVLVTAHDAFSYFGRRYNYEVVGIQGLSTESEAGIRDIERIVSLLVDRKIPAVFVESTVSERNVRALIEGARAKGHSVRIGGELFSDAMGPAGTKEGTYLGMIEHNVTTIVQGLGGEISESLEDASGSEHDTGESQKHAN